MDTPAVIKEVTAERAGYRHVPGLKVIGTDRMTKRGEVASMGLSAPDELLDGGAKERPGTARWLYQVQGTEITVGGVPGQVEQYLDHPSAGEHLAVVLDAGRCKCHRHTLGTGTDTRHARHGPGFIVRAGSSS